MTLTATYDIDTGKPWFGQGTEVTGELTIAAALAAGGLDWTVAKVPMYARFGSRYLKATDRFAVQRSKDGVVLGTVGGDYVPFQNTEAFAFLDALLADGKITLDTLGSLFGGKRVWVTARLDDFSVLGDDEFQQYLFITNSHDGSRALQATVVPIRVLGASTVPMSQAFRIRHRGGLEGKHQEANETLEAATKYTNEFKDTAEALAKRDAPADAFEEIMRHAFPDQKRQLAANLQSVKIIRNESPRIPDDLRPTAYGALSALTEWTSWGKEYRTGEARMKSLLMGWSRNVVTQVTADLLKL